MPGPSTGEKRKRGEDEVNKDDQSQEKPVTYSLLPKNHVENEAKQATEEKHHLKILAIPGVVEARKEENQRILLRLYQTGFLSNDGYDKLAILHNGDIGLENGQPLIERMPSDTAIAPLATAPATAPTAAEGSEGERLLTEQQWEHIFTALNRRPGTWDTIWVDIGDWLRAVKLAGDTVTLVGFQNQMQKMKGSHLRHLQYFLELIQQGSTELFPVGLDDFQRWSHRIRIRLFALFGIRGYRSNRVQRSRQGLSIFEDPRSWCPDFSNKDEGIKEGVRRLEGGDAVGEALEPFMSERCETVKREDEELAKRAVNALRGLLHYVERSGTVCTDVEVVFGDFGVPLGNMKFAEEEARIQQLYDAVKKDMALASNQGCQGG